MADPLLDNPGHNAHALPLVDAQVHGHLLRMRRVIQERSLLISLNQDRVDIMSGLPHICVVNSLPQPPVSAGNHLGSRRRKWWFYRYLLYDLLIYLL